MEERLRLAEGKPRARVLMAAMAQLDCGACGYVCKTYAEAIADGTEKCLSLCAPGGSATAVALKKIVGRSPPLAPPDRPAAEPAPARQTASTLHDRRNPFPAQLVRHARLNGPGSAKDTRLVVLDIGQNGIRYEPGDSLGVFPENCPDLVQAVIETLGATGEEAVPAPDGSQASLREALARRYALNRTTDELRALVGAGGAPDEDVLDLLMARGRGSVDVLRFLSALDPLQPRLYSISSSLKAHPSEVHLTVGVVRYEVRGRQRKGVASTYLAEQVKEGQSVRVFMHASPGFRLPRNDDAPLVFIGPGTGIAPFRAFLQERKARGARGKNWLFFGDQRREHDFLYAAELEAYRKEGLLTRLDTAFSRDQAEKVYVQHRMLERSRELWEWIEDGAHVYVCGDARRMAGDVDRALEEILVREGGKSTPEARHYLAELTRQKRYQKDVY
jgi:sulfite reductase (NADPH) flavoprotein alpha-component